MSAIQARADCFAAPQRYIHQHSEIGFQDFRASALVAKCLRRWGYDVTIGLGDTGFVGQLKRGCGNRKKVTAWFITPTTLNTATYRWVHFLRRVD